MTTDERNPRELLQRLHEIACEYDWQRYGLPVHSEAQIAAMSEAVEKWLGSPADVTRDGGQ